MLHTLQLLSVAETAHVLAAAQSAVSTLTAAAPEYDEFGALILRRHSDGVTLTVRRTYHGEGEYEGETRRGQRHGRGRMTYTTGTVFDGSWAGDRWDGPSCSIRFADGRTYSGGCRAGELDGEGTMTWPSPSPSSDRAASGIAGAAAVTATLLRAFADSSSPISVAGWALASARGPWHKGTPHGPGAVLVYRNGSEYSGDVQHGEVAGSGSLHVSVPTAAAGEPEFSLRTSGTWSSGVLAGDACVVERTLASKHDTYTGGFVGGLRHGAGIADLDDGSHYEGQWAHGRRNGLGTLRGTDQALYDGKFVGDKRCGRGTCAFPNGDVYCGLWSDDAMHGAGTLRHADGSEVVGVWARGTLAT